MIGLLILDAAAVCYALAEAYCISCYLVWSMVADYGSCLVLGFWERWKSCGFREELMLSMVLFVWGARGYGYWSSVGGVLSLIEVLPSLAYQGWCCYLGS
ncbi:hypothetical protein Tco_0271580 [Tanacetum coccineum]